MSRYKEFVSNTLIFTLGSIGSKLISFFLVPLYTNYLTTAEYGITDLVITISNFAVPFLSAVIYDAVLRFGLAKSSNKQAIITNAVAVLIIGSIASFLIFPLIKLYKPVSQWAIYVVLLTIFTMFSNTLFTYLKIQDKNKQYAFFSIAYTAILAILNIVLIVACSAGVRGYLLSNILALGIITFLMFFASGAVHDIHKKYFSWALCKEMLGYSLPLVLNGIMWWVISGSSKLILEHYASASALGIYVAATKIPAIQSIFISIFQQSWTISAITEYENSGDKAFYSNIFEYYTFFVGLTTIIILCVIKDFMRIYVGADFFSSWQYVPILLLGNFFYSISVFCGSIYSAVKKNKQVMLTTVICAVCAVVSGFVVIPRFGTLGAALSVLIAYSVIGIFRLFDTSRFLRFPIKWFKLFASSIIVTALSVCVALDFLNYVLSGVAICVMLVMYKNEMLRIWKILKKHRFWRDN